MERITLIEDDRDAAAMVTAMLSKAGYIVNVLHEGKAIVEQDFVLPDVFILDNFMPAIDGVAICKYLKLKHQTRKIPVIIVSGDPDVETKASKAGATTFLRKPFTGQQLLDCLRVLARSKPAAPVM